VFPGDLLTTLALDNNHELITTTNVVLTDTIPTGTTFVSATEPYTHTGDTIRWDFPSLEPLSNLTVDLVVEVNSGFGGDLVNENYAAYSDHAALVAGEPVSTFVERVFYLPFLVRNP
jgi:uncharacterized repeat protein (TIGR01451 family)